MPETTESLIARIRAVAEATPNPCEGSAGHLRDEFAWEVEDDLRKLRAGESLDFTEDALRADCVAALERWAQ